MIDVEESTFQMSVVELFVVILFIVIAFSNSLVSDSVPEGEIEITQADVDSLKAIIDSLEVLTTTDVDSLVESNDSLQLIIADINYELDSLVKDIYGTDNSDSITELLRQLAIITSEYNLMMDEIAQNELTGTGRGSCWKENDQSISLLQITLYDDEFRLEPDWPNEYSQRARAILDDSLYESLQNSGSLTVSNREFLNRLNSIQVTGENNSPPCYFIASAIDSTTTKPTFLRQEQIASRIFVLDRSNIWGANN